MNNINIQLIIQYALLVAASSQDWRERELGPIHFVKYVYLADLVYAQEREGKTYTQADWSFYKFGPWSASVYEQIDPALNAIGAQKKEIPGSFSDEFYRWSLAGLDCASLQNVKSNVSSQLPVEICLALDSYVKEYGSDTHELLRHVYLTSPMLKSAPGERLVFGYREPRISTETKTFAAKAGLSKGQKKRREAKISRVREELERRFTAKETRRREIEANSQPPRYDDIFFEGLAFLDAAAGEGIVPGDFTCALSDEIWKSRARYDPDLPD